MIVDPTPLVGLPLIVLPSQHFALPRKEAPEQRLMIAVLYNAFDCVEKHRFTTRHPGRRLYREAKRWFLADEPDWPYSFERICGALDLDATAVRERLCVAPDRPDPGPRVRERYPGTAGPGTDVQSARGD